MSQPRTVTRNVLFNWAGMFLAIVFGFIQSPIVVNGLGHAWYGVWVLVNQLTNYTWLFDVGIREGVVRYVSRHHGRGEYDIINEVVSSAVYLYLAISAVTVAFVVGVAALLPHLFTLDAASLPVARLALVVVGVNIAINWFFNAYIGILMGLQRFDIFQKIGIFTTTTHFVLVLIAMQSGSGILALAGISLGVSAVSNALVLWNCRRLFPQLAILPPRRDRLHFGVLFNYGKFVFLNNLGAKVVHGSGVVITGMFLPVSQIPFYAVPSQLVTYMGNLVSSAAQVLNPLASALEGRDDVERIQQVLIRGTQVSMVVAVPIAVVYTLMGRQFLSLWIGPEFGGQASTVLALLAIPSAFGMARHAVSSVLYGTSRHHVAAYVQVAEAALNVALTLVLVRRLGLVGVAAAMALSHLLFMGVILPVLGARTLGLPAGRYWLQAVLPPVVSAVPFAAGCALVNATMPAGNLLVFFVQVALLLPLYAAACWMACLSRTERVALLATLSSRLRPLTAAAGAHQGLNRDV